MTLNNNQTERRMYQRFATDLPVMCRGTFLCGPGKCLNASMGGVQLTTEEDIAVNTVINVELIATQYRPNPVRVTGKVIWTAPATDDNLNILGISFICNFAQSTKFLSETFAQQQK
jgi:hypothetical protein